MNLNVTVRHKVEFNELDPMNVVWHGNYINFFEQARCALLEKIRYDYRQMKQDGYVWPVAKLRCKYIRPAVFRQVIDITGELIEYHNTLTIKFTIRDAETGATLVKGETMQMPVSIETGLSSMETPARFVELVEAAMQREQETGSPE